MSVRDTSGSASATRQLGRVGDPPVTGSRSVRRHVVGAAAVTAS
jgi:hypothetical protein